MLNKTRQKDEPVPDRVSLDTAVTYPPAWLSWVAATTGCLRSLGHDVDLVDVAGHSGYAFSLVIHDDLCPSGPTSLPWGPLTEGIPSLGRTPLTFWGGLGTDGKATGQIRDHCRNAYELVESEIRQNRPCVLWGTYLPEFGIAVGVDAGAFIVESFRANSGESQPPIPFDELAIPGGPYVLAFPAAVTLDPGEADRRAIVAAAHAMQAAIGWPQYHTGREAYDAWIAGLEGNPYDTMGASYNAQCWAEARRGAAEFTGRLVERHPGNRELTEAAKALAITAEALTEVAERFPFPGTSRASGADLEATVGHLTKARESDAAATRALIGAARAAFGR
jgi:hypothetical protein